MTITLREACARYARTALPPLRLSDVPATVALAERLAKTLGPTTIERPPQEDLDRICGRIDEALAKGALLSRIDLRRAPWCLFATKTPLADRPGRLDALLDQIAKAGRPKVYRALAQAYLYAFEPSRPALAAVGHFLARHVEDLGSPWLEAHRSLELFVPDRAPAMVAGLALARGRTPDDVLADAGLGDTVQAGFRKEAYLQGSTRLERGGSSNPLRRLDIVERWVFAEPGKVRFEALRAAGVDAAVLPFGDAMPDKATRDRCLGLVLSLCGDPRTNPARWAGCSRAEPIVRRWLTEQSLQQFFDIVGRVATIQHWTYRRAFWEGLYRKGYIDEAWVVFGRKGADEAERLLGKDVSFGRFLPGGGVQAGHSVLLMKIGALTIAEWSHVGRCSFWDETRGERGPSLYQGHYHAVDLRKAVTGTNAYENFAKQGVFEHHDAATYSWQDRIAKFLRARLNIDIRRVDYEVR